MHRRRQAALEALGGSDVSGMRQLCAASSMHGSPLRASLHCAFERKDQQPACC